MLCFGCRSKRAGAVKFGEDDHVAVRECFDRAGLFCLLKEQTDVVPRTISCYCLAYSDLLCTVFWFLSGLTGHHFESICSTSCVVERTAYSCQKMQR